MGPLKAVDASAGGAFLTGAGVRQIGGASLRAGADAATATIRETDGAGRILAVLGAGIGLTDHWNPGGPVAFSGNVHVTLTGTTPKCILLEA